MGVFSEVATTVAESAVPSKKLRVKILAKKPVSEAFEISQATVVNSLKKQPLTDGRSKSLIVERNLGSNQGTKHVSCLGKSSVTQNQMKPGIDSKKSDSVANFKRKSEEVLEGHGRKRLKMDRSATVNCQTILAKLMKDKLGGPFCIPVDPDAWGGIDDYFDIIKNPMDLGTIQKKLQKKTYNYVEEFEADVRLTFSNAMLYNPPDNWVHISAKELDMMFTRLWKGDKKRIDGENKYMKHQVDIKQRGLINSHDKFTCDVKGKSDKTQINEEKKGNKQQVDIKQRGPESTHDKITSDGKHRCLISFSSQVGQLPGKTMPQKERSSEAFKKVPVEGQQLNDHNVLKPQDCKPKESSSSKELDFTTFPSTSFLGVTAQGSEYMDIDISPSKALRVARLKSRFADTILKAQHQTLLEPGSETNATNWLQEKLILERRQQEEKARIEAQIKAVESAARLKAEAELKQQREAAREAARLAVEKMKRSVDLEDNLHVLRDLEAMVGSSLVVVCQDHRSRTAVWSQIESKNLSPLQQLGLYIKEEYMVGDDDDEYDVEEGEVVN